ncbi:hypothetical protein FRC02_000989 [Tulasnella sp. 418]|nr:hypothetical protein FRC02_000989 [Tulasnella sp. 418]
MILSILLVRDQEQVVTFSTHLDLALEHQQIVNDKLPSTRRLVVFSGLLPLEVQSVIRTIEFRQSAYSGHVNSTTNVSFVVSATTCLFGIQASQRAQGSSTSQQAVGNLK